MVKGFVLDDERLKPTTSRNGLRRGPGPA